MKTVIFFLFGILCAVAGRTQIVHVPDALHPTIQSAINDSLAGDTIIVAEGTYDGQLNYLGRKSLVVASEFLLDGDTSHIRKTILDGSGISSTDSGSIVYFISGEDTTSVLCGFTITNGNIGTAAAYPTGGTIQSGGAIYLFGSGAKIVYNHITRNTIINGTGAGISAGQWWEDPHWVVIDHNTIDYNSTSSVNNKTFGAGICVTCNSRIINNIITNNSCHGSGSSGGAGILAGGELFWEKLEAEVRNNIIRDNFTSSNNSYSGGAGGVLQCIKGIVAGNIVENNAVNANILASTGGGGIIFWAPRTGTSISGNTFRNNTTSGSGGALYLELISGNVGSDTVLVESNYFIGNKAAFGGALFTTENPVVVQNNVFCRNSVSKQGGAIRLSFTQAGKHGAIVKNNSFNENKAYIRGGAISSLNGRPLVINTIFWNDSSDVQYGPEISLSGINDTAEIAYTGIDPDKITGPWVNREGNLAQDPLFKDHDSLFIPHNSPCFNKGTLKFTCQCGMNHVSPVYDISGIIRPLYDFIDMGAHEYKSGEGIWSHKQEPSLSCAVIPNPVDKITSFTYTLKEPCMVTITVFNAFGQLIAIPLNSLQQKGDQLVSWNPGHISPGIYFFRIKAGEKIGTGKIVKN